MRNILNCLLLALILGNPVLAQKENRIDLFDGKTLDGWSIHSGFAKYRVEDGVIIGTTVTKSPNTFLCTEKEFGDFILEFEVMVDPRLNSGVQFRSKIAPEELTYWLRDEKGFSFKLEQKVSDGWDLKIAKEWLSPSYGVKKKAWVACFSRDAQLPIKTAFLLNTILSIRK